VTAPPAAVRDAAAHFPLICRNQLTYPSLAARLEELHTCAARSQTGPLNERLNAACATWNLAALIASDCGRPDLAA
jgi:hypothetical protein